MATVALPTGSISGGIAIVRIILWPMVASAVLLGGCGETPAPTQSAAKPEAKSTVANAVTAAAAAKSVVLSVTGMS